MCIRDSYYAHLSSYGQVEIGDEVKAGDLLGYMGDSGYGKEGTTGQFPVHLHVGIYLQENGKEISINPVSYTHLDVYKRQPLQKHCSRK